jgi:hypothetical protein
MSSGADGGGVCAWIVASRSILVCAIRQVQGVTRQAMRDVRSRCPVTCVRCRLCPLHAVPEREVQPPCVRCGVGAGAVSCVGSVLIAVSAHLCFKVLFCDSRCQMFYKGGLSSRSVSGGCSSVLARVCPSWLCRYGGLVCVGGWEARWFHVLSGDYGNLRCV